MKDDVPKKEKKPGKILVNVLNKTALAKNKKILGKTVEVLAMEKTKNGFWAKQGITKQLGLRPVMSLLESLLK